MLRFRAADFTAKLPWFYHGAPFDAPAQSDVFSFEVNGLDLPGGRLAVTLALEEPRACLPISHDGTHFTDCLARGTLVPLAPVDLCTRCLRFYFRSGSPDAPSPLREVYLDALRWGVGLLRMPAMGDRVTGLRGLAAWAAEMRDDAAFPAGDEGAMAERYVSTTINITMLRDHCQAEPFLAQVAADAPDLAPEALQAAACYGRVARIRARMDDLIPDDFTERGIRGIHDPAVRRAFADEVLRIRDAEAESVGCLERLLARCG